MESRVGNGDDEVLALAELQLDTLGVGDSVTLRTVAGSIYRLNITGVEDRGPLATIDKYVGQDEEVIRDNRPIWNHVHQEEFIIEGACGNEVLQYGTALITKDEIPGIIRLGLRSKFWNPTGHSDQDVLLTSPVQSISVKKAAD